MLIIVSFSVERYLAICHPLHVFAMGDFQRGLRVIRYVPCQNGMSSTIFEIKAYLLTNRGVRPGDYSCDLTNFFFNFFFSIFFYKKTILNQAKLPAGPLSNVTCYYYYMEHISKV